MDDYRFDDECLEEGDERVQMAVLDGLFEETIETIRAGLFTVILLAAAHFAAVTAEEVLSVSADREDTNSRSRRDAKSRRGSLDTQQHLLRVLGAAIGGGVRISDAVRYAWYGLSRSAGGTEQDRTTQQERRSLLQKCWS